VIRPSSLLLALSLIFFLAHAASLPTSFADLDAINFALGVRDFDVARHQPHPPGYPVFIAAAKASTPLLAAMGIAAPEVRGLAILSSIAGALLLPLLFLLFRELTNDRAIAVWGAVVTAVAPLVWFNALRPLSDLAGVAVFVLAQALLVSVIARPSDRNGSQRLILGAIVAGVSIGIRSQNFVLTLPLLAVALVLPRSCLTARHRLQAIAAFCLAVISWGIPLVMANGGLEAYVAALRAQADEDFSGVVMLWTSRSARVALDGIRHSFLWPWGTLAAGWVVVLGAAVGAVRMLRNAPRSLAILVVAFGPYAVFHLLFHETVTTRYALPLVIPAALLLAYALAGPGPGALYGGSAALVAWCLFVTLPAAQLYADRPAPSFSALSDALERSAPADLVAMHAVMRRTEQWYHDNASGRVIRSRHGHEIDVLVKRWLSEPDRHVTFVADPRRSDLAMLDPRSRARTRAYEWPFPELPFVGGARPSEALLYSLSPPGWMLETGWAITAEVGGRTTRDRAEPHRRPAVAWVRVRSEESTLMIGGRNLSPSGSEPARITVSIGGRAFDSFEAGPGYFFETRILPVGALTAGDPYVPVQVTATGAGDEPASVSLEQFDLQSTGVPMVGFTGGWHEPEYNQAEGHAWRWMSDRATLWVRPVGRDVTLTLSAESPLRYFDQPPILRVSAGGQLLAQFSPTRDFSQEVKIPRELLSAREQVVIESDKSFVPANGDPRVLALRVYGVEVN
jgi:hypothetical protein